jgi:hypothetical protein
MFQSCHNELQILIEISTRFSEFQLYYATFYYHMLQHLDRIYWQLTLPGKRQIRPRLHIPGLDEPFFQILNGEALEQIPVPYTDGPREIALF